MINCPFREAVPIHMVQTSPRSPYARIFTGAGHSAELPWGIAKELVLDRNTHASIADGQTVPSASNVAWCARAWIRMCSTPARPLSSHYEVGREY